MRKKIFALLLLCTALTAAAKVKLPALMGDNMVLQQQADARLWGWADAGATVRVTTSWDQQTRACRADGEGRWLLTVPTPAGSYTPYEITFDDGEPVTLRNVLVGEVWLASGQSNMEMPLRGFGGCCVQDGVDEVIAAADHPYVRFFTVPLNMSHELEYDCAAAWQVPSVHTAAGFSATAWFFATSLEKALRVPVGMIVSAFGGTRVESWLSREVLQGYPDVNLQREAIDAYEPAYMRPMLMYNAMQVPVRNYTFKGIIWYQGEGNVGAHQTYAQRLADMVRLWRSDFRLGDPYLPADNDPKRFTHEGRLYYMPWESTVCLSQRWFYHTDDHTYKSVKELADLYRQATKNGNILILNCPPGRDGRLRQTDVKLLRKLRKALQLKKTHEP